MVVWLHLKHISLSFNAYNIDFSRFHNELKHLCSLKLVSILETTLWKIVIKLLFSFVTFWLFFPFWGSKLYLTKIKYPINLIFSVVVCIYKIHVFNGVITCQIIQNFWNISYFFEIFTSRRYHRDMKILRILASNSKHFRIYRIFKKWKIDMLWLTF